LMDVFVYFKGQLGIPISEIEDELDELFEEFGEVTGAGSGVQGSNIDIELEDTSLSDQEILALLKKCFDKFKVYPLAEVKIEERRYRDGSLIT